MNKRETHIVTGMTRDLATSRFEPTYVYEAHNIRIRVVGNDSTLLSVTNEKGTEEFELTGNTTYMRGTIIGTASFTKTLVVFSTDPDYGFDYIFRIDFDEDFDTAEISILYNGEMNGSLHFDIEHPIEALAIYENESIQKVYWVDGINQPRMINICKGEQTNPDIFNFNREIGADAKMVVTKYNSGGEFRPGTVQYCFNYFDKFGQETNIVDVSPLYYISPKDSGLAADDISGCSFSITLSDLNTNFDYVRLYAIYRSSENATPSVRIVGDYAIPSDGSDDIIVADTGVYGETLDAEALLFIGGQYIVAETLADKDNTLFLGNLKNVVPNIGNIETFIHNIPLKDLHNHVGSQQGDLVELYSTSFDRYGNGALFEPEEEIPITSYTIPQIKYDYIKDNNRSSFAVKGFKARENYRLGFIAQYKTGQWSEAIWLGDFDEECLSGLYWFFYEQTMVGKTINPWGKQLRSAGYEAVLDREIVTSLINNDFIKVCPVVVYPNIKDRQIICQGLLCPSVFNIQDRADNTPYTQCDWRFRPSYSWNRIKDEIQSNVTSTFRDIPENSYAPDIPFAYYKKSDMQSFNVMKDEEFVKYFPTEYYLDPSVVTFHSPDIDSSQELRKDDLVDVQLRLVGFSNGGFGTFAGTHDNPDPVLDPYLTTAGVEAKSTIHTYIGLETNGFGNLSKVLTPNTTTINSLSSTLRGNGFYDNAIDVTSTDELKKFSRDPDDDLYFYWFTYLWHRNGSLNNHENLTNGQSIAGATKTAQYSRKVISEKTLGYTTYFYYPQNTIPSTDYSINVPLKQTVLFDSDQKSFEKLNTAFDSDKSYYGNIDRALLTPLEDNSSVSFYSADLDQSLSTQGNNFSTGYPIRTGLMEDRSAGSQNPSHLQDFYEGIQPTRIRYKTTRHAVLSLGGHDPSEIMQIGVPTLNSYYIYWLNTQKLFAGAYLRDHIYGQDTNDQHFDYSFVNDCMYIGELYRSMTHEQQVSRFGGSSQEALAANTWTIAGEAITLRDGDDVTLKFKEGDTYFGRYDCLKAYPYTQEDKQSIVSIYSTELESRVNLDFRYGNTMNLDDNTLVTPQNFNLYNHGGYEQTNQYFTFKALDYDRYLDQSFPNMITWSKEKTLGEDIDTWTSIPMLSTLDLDGTKGEISKLVRFNNEILAFQDNAFAQILFNSRVQIPVSDGVPVEITNGYKVDGKRYISESIGMSNKWSMAVSPYALYFADDSKNSLYAYNGQLTDLSSAKGMKTWMYDKGNDFRPVWNPRDYGNLRTFYDKIYGDVYFTTKNTSLIYSEQIGNFTSFMDYGGVTSMNNMGNKFLSFTTSDDNSSRMWEMWEGDYNMFFDEFKPYWMTFIANENPIKDKIFNNLEWRSVVYDKDGNYLPYSTFDTMRIWHEHQDTGCINLKDNIGIPSSLKKKFNAFRTYIPRDAKGLWSPPNMQRIRNPWTYIRLAKIEENTDQMVFTDLNVDFFE